MQLEKMELIQDGHRQFLTPKVAKAFIALDLTMHEAEVIRAEEAEKMQFIATFQDCLQAMAIQFQHPMQKNIAHQIQTIDTQTH